MVKKPAVVSAALVSLAVTLTVAAPANAATRYYQQSVSGASQMECEAAGSQLAQQKMAEGYLVTWVGCGHSNFHWVGVVAWSD
ncbi:hypothetical protein [Amycolatopsis sp. cmx-4-68]|uniref:hypothetical protein n=1 Tax=Amycolatopsis sp. cmx-4-68 TaxID=2790938 RepID=UPI00397C0383